MKKLLLGLGTVSLVILPLAAMVSCSSDVKPPVEVVKADLGITRKLGVDQVTITAAASVINGTPAPEAAALLTSLDTVFEGVTSTDNFTIAVTGDKDNEVITLTANEGFAFGAEKTLVSKIDLQIKINTEASQPQISAAVVLLNADATITNADTLAAFKLVFSGITDVNAKFITAVATGDKDNEVITLTAKAGYVFGTEATTLVSKVKAE